MRAPKTVRSAEALGRVRDPDLVWGQVFRSSMDRDMKPPVPTLAPSENLLPAPTDIFPPTCGDAAPRRARIMSENTAGLQSDVHVAEAVALTLWGPGTPHGNFSPTSAPQPRSACRPGDF